MMMAATVPTSETRDEYATLAARLRITGMIRDLLRSVSHDGQLVAETRRAMDVACDEVVAQMPETERRAYFAQIVTR